MGFQLVRIVNPALLRHQQFSRNIVRTLKSQSRISLVQGQTTSNKEFWSKNKELSRPMSPHLTIYKFELPAILSICHRITGLGASFVLYFGGIGSIFCNQSFPEIVHLIQSVVPPTFLLLTKTALGGTLIYHSLNGVRHLIWDAGYGFQLKHLYMSGYFVVAMTAIGTAMIFMRG